MQKIKSGFTLVELLIVVVIIGILSAALLPRLTGHMARTRDLKRQADLRNIAAAVEMYRNHHGDFPLRELKTSDKGEYLYNGNNFLWDGKPLWEFLYSFGDVQGLEDVLSPYLSQTPKDPQAGSRVKIHYDSNSSVPHRRQLAEAAISPGSYVYQILEAKASNRKVAFLIAKVETADLANYVTFNKAHHLTKPHFMGKYRGYKQSNLDADDLKLCTSVTKVAQGQERFLLQENGRVDCAYSSIDQLYYVLPID